MVGWSEPVTKGEIGLLPAWLWCVFVSHTRLLVVVAAPLQTLSEVVWWLDGAGFDSFMAGGNQKLYQLNVGNAATILPKAWYVTSCTCAHLRLSLYYCVLCAPWLSGHANIVALRRNFELAAAIQDEFVTMRQPLDEV